MGSEADDDDEEVNRLAIQSESSIEEEKNGEERRRRNAAEIDAESVLVKSVTQTYEESSNHHLRMSATNAFGVHNKASMSVFANRSQSQFTTLPR